MVCKAIPSQLKGNTEVHWQAKQQSIPSRAECLIKRRLLANGMDPKK